MYTISKPDRHLSGDIHLDGSKSISNRALIIRALCGQPFKIERISSSKDTRLMQALLASDAETLDAGAAGTTFRFLTAYLSQRAGSQILTGTERMKQRPVGVLVEALRKLGADIEYLENEGFPPLKINPPNPNGVAEIKIESHISSQYISAILMIAPTLPNGLTVHLVSPPHLGGQGGAVSRPYLEMTLRMMEYFGVKHEWEGNSISIAPQKYKAKDFLVEADWSAASYWYEMAAFAETCDLTLHGLFAESMQGDSALPQIMEGFGVRSEFTDGKIHLTKSGDQKPLFEYDFLPCPDLAQTLAVTCAGTGVQGLFTGLETLRIKETDRIAALQAELAKVQVFLTQLPGRFVPGQSKEFFMVDGIANVSGAPIFKTYEDHRMAMAFAPLAMLGEVKIEEPEVVVKSYPAFWDDLKKMGFEVHQT